MPLTLLISCTRLPGFLTEAKNFQYDTVRLQYTLIIVAAHEVMQRYKSESIIKRDSLYLSDIILPEF